MSDAILLTSQQPEGDRKGPRSSAPAGPLSDDARAASRISLIPAGFSFEGLVVIDGAARIEGSLRGDVEGRGRFEIASGGDFEGRIEVDELIVAGSAKGELRARTRMELRAGAEVTGSVAAPSLNMLDGAQLEGRCETAPSADRRDPKGETPPPAG